jgi:hypothetical protein
MIPADNRLPAAASPPDFLFPAVSALDRGNLNNLLQLNRL